MADSDDEEVKLPGLPPNTKNYMTPACYRRLLDEREHLVNVERPDVVNVVAWAATVTAAKTVTICTAKNDCVRLIAAFAF